MIRQVDLFAIVRPVFGGGLTKVECSKAWAHEASAFTLWLAEEKNLARLVKELGLELELEGVEVPVGPYLC